MILDPILFIDGYKVGHKFQYHPETTVVYSNFTARSDKYFNSLFALKGKMLWAGLSGVMAQLEESFRLNFFEVPLEKVLAKYKRRMDAYLGPDSVDTSHIEALHNLGYLPVVISALPEGSLVDMRVPLMSIANTHEDFYWVPNYLETIISAMLWHQCTSATTAFNYRYLLEQYAEKTGAPKDFVLWQGHDFSFRGLPGAEAAAMSGAGHLFSFLGTDTLPAIDYLETYYDVENEYIGGSVPASEHSVASTNILYLEEKYRDSANPKLEAEKEFFKRYITEIYPSGVCSYVSDTYDFWKVITEVAESAKEEIMNRKPNHLGLSKVVFRPDSGDPVEILCGVEVLKADSFDELGDIASDLFTEGVPHGERGDEEITFLAEVEGQGLWKVTAEAFWNRHDKQYYYLDGIERISSVPYEMTPEEKGAVQVLSEIFGYTLTDKGYKMLCDKVGLIYGDSITLDRAQQILRRLADKGFASSNVVFGIGSFTYQHCTRDSLGFAMKTTYSIADEKEIAVYKDPKTDDGTKKSAKGLFVVTQNDDGSFVMEDNMLLDEFELKNLSSAYVPVFMDGVMEKEKLSAIRQRINSNITRLTK